MLRIRLLSLFLLVVTIIVPTTVLSSSKQYENNNNDESDEDNGTLDAQPVPIPDPFVPPSISGPRSGRFPSIEERIKLYMSNWYLPSCPGYTNGLIQYEYRRSTENRKFTSVWLQEPMDRKNYSDFILESAVIPDKAFVLDEGTILDCSIPGDGHQEYIDRIEFRSNMYMYCLDVTTLVLPAVRHIELEHSQQQLWNEKERRQLVEVVSNTYDDNNNNNHNNEEEQEQRLVRRSILETVPAYDEYANEDNDQSPFPVLFQFGDLKHSHEYRYMKIPHFKKFRSAAVSPDALAKVTSVSSSESKSKKQCYDQPRAMLEAYHRDDVTNEMVFQPIVMKLATRRHFKLLDDVIENDTPWNEKRNMAVFRGQLTGSRDGFQKGLTDEQNCLKLRRCRLVYNHANSTLIHARLTNTKGRLPNILNGIELVSASVPISDLLTFKGLIMLEGNDVASGLKWALLSQSVVLMPQPKHTSWAMEELLQPWVHYIPISDSLVDVEEKMQWVVDNDESARRIAERGSLWMQDLVYHPDAMEDDTIIREEIIRRYAQHFVPVPKQPKQDDKDDDDERK